MAVRIVGAAFAAVAPAGRRHLVYYELASWPGVDQVVFDSTNEAIPVTHF